MDTPGYDPVSMTGIVAGGANVLVFTTGRGSVFGCKPAPSIKVATNTPMYEHMIDDMDINAGVILEGTPVEEVGRQIFEEILAVASGKKTKSEIERRRRGGVRPVEHRADVIKLISLVLRLCLGTRCREAPPRAGTRHGATARVVATRREAEPRQQCVPRLRLGTRTVSAHCQPLTDDAEQIARVTKHQPGEQAEGVGDVGHRNNHVEIPAQEQPADHQHYRARRHLEAESRFVTRLDPHVAEEAVEYARHATELAAGVEDKTAVDVEHRLPQ